MVRGFGLRTLGIGDLGFGLKVLGANHLNFLNQDMSRGARECM